MCGRDASSGMLSRLSRTVNLLVERGRVLNSVCGGELATAGVAISVRNL